MRELKFRAFDKKEKKWLLGYELPHLGGFNLLGEVVLEGELAGVALPYLFGRDGLKRDDLVITQYTGLKDKNGKEIYEGDILLTDKGIKGEVIWSDERVRLTIRYKNIWSKTPHWIHKALFWANSRSVVVGNIYENLNLLEANDAK